VVGGAHGWCHWPTINLGGRGVSPVLRARKWWPVSRTGGRFDECQTLPAGRATGGSHCCLW
jgi:hypothetical protein